MAVHSLGGGRLDAPLSVRAGRQNLWLGCSSGPYVVFGPCYPQNVGFMVLMLSSDPVTFKPAWCVMLKVRRDHVGAAEGRFGTGLESELETGCNAVLTTSSGMQPTGLPTLVSA